MMFSITIPRNVGFRGLGALVAVGCTMFLAFVGLALGEERTISFSDGRASAELEVPLGQSLTINTQLQIGRLNVADPALASVVPLSDSAFQISGLALGRTNVSVHGAGGAQGVINVEVTPDLQDLRQTLVQAMPGTRITVDTVNGRLRLSGSVPDAVSVSRAVEIAEQYGSTTVINALRVASAQQVLLEVRFVEASRSGGQELGVSWFGSGQGATFTTGSGSSGGVSLDSNMSSGSVPFGSLISQVLGFGVSADVLIQALERNGLARRLAEPNLVALSGEEASFLAGGEVPVPVAEEEGRITVAYKEYGVRLNFTPTVLESGLINLRLEPEVSQVDFSTSVRTGAVEIPAFTSRRVTTTVELRDGQSFAIAGLLQSNNVRSATQVPVLGQLPIIGALFRSSSYQKQETDLVVIVTARLAQPAAPGVPLRTPLDDTDPTGELEFFFTGKQEVTNADLRAYAEGDGIIGPFGHIIEIAP